VCRFGAVFENEIGIIVGKKGRRIPEDESAYDYIYGYTVYNDVTDYGKQITGAFNSKIHDTFCPMGPCIVTKDEIEDPHDLIKRAWVNGLLAMETSTSEMLRKVPEFVSIPSRTLTLQPGCIISTGTPSTGRIMPGDELELEITKIGKIQNKVIVEK
jgi:2-keto-4-pentenoate hydratase/2-oxohepta-3-ene-1,7-dioic acid hydratase in catechol pathway